MDWIEELLLKRRAAQTSVYIIETFDLKRIDQFTDGFPHIFPNHELLHLNVQTGELARSFTSVQTAYEKGKCRLCKADTREMAVPSESFCSKEHKSEWEKKLSKGSQVIPADPTVGPLQSLHQHLTKGPSVGVISYILVQQQAEPLYNHMLTWHQSLFGVKKLNSVLIFTASIDYFPTTLRRFLHTISVPASTAEERKAVLDRVTEQISEAGGPKLQVNGGIIDASAGLTLHDVESAALESFYKSGLSKVRVQEFTERKMTILKQFGIEYVEPTRGFETIAGYKALKDYIQWRVIRPLREPLEAKKYGLAVPKGLLLIGPPGVGKTYFAKALAKEVGLTMLKITPADFLRSFVGESESRVRQITLLIETMSPCIVLMDEFDQISLERSTTAVTDSGASRRMQNMLLDWMSNERKSFIIGATNFARLDKAFVRPGRIDDVVPVLPPDKEARADILRVHSQVIRSIPMDPDVDLQKLADQTKAWSGAELEKLVLDATALAFKESAGTVKMVHFLEAMYGFEVNIQQREASLNNLINEIRQLEQYNKAFLDQQLQEYMTKEAGKDERIAGLMK